MSLTGLRLAVQACKGEDVGMNLVFLAYPDFCALTGGKEKGDSVRVMIEDSCIFFVRISMGVQRGTIGMDSMQRSAMQASIHDRVAVRLWEGPQIPIRRIQLTVDLPSYPGKGAAEIDSIELIKTVHRCLADNMLHPKQYLLAVACGVQLRLRVVGVETPKMELLIALVMALHARLGAASRMSVLNCAQIRKIADLALGPMSEDQSFILTRASVIDCQAQPNSPVNLRKQVRNMFLDKNGQNSSSRGFGRNHAPSPAVSMLSKHSEGVGESLDEPADGKNFFELSLSQDANGQVVVNNTLCCGESDQKLLSGDIIESINGQNVYRSGVRKVEEMARCPRGTFVTFGVIRGGHSCFVTLESNQVTPCQHHKSEATFSDYASHGPQSKDFIASTSIDNSSDRFSVSPVLSASSMDKYSPSVGRRSATPPEPWTGDFAGSVLRHSPKIELPANDVGARSDVRAAVEDLAKENERLRAALSTQQKLVEDQGRSLLQERGRVELAEQLALSLESQLQLVQRQLQDVQEDLREQSRREVQMQQRLSEAENEVLHLRGELDQTLEQLSAQGPSVDRDSIVRLEEMVETLLNLGEQEASALRQDLQVQNRDLKFILGQLQRAELVQSGITVPNTLTFSHHASLASHTSLNGVPKGSARVGALPKAGVPEKGLMALSSSLHYISSSSGEPQECVNAASRGGLYLSLSEATASLRSASPDIEPLATHMSPFVVKAPPRTWEETISLLGSSRRDNHPTFNSSSQKPKQSRQSLPISYTPGEVREDAPRQARMSASHLTWEDAMAGYSRLTTNSLSTPEKHQSLHHMSMNSSRVDSSGQARRRSGGLARSGPTWRATGDSIAGNFLTSDRMNKKMHINKFVPAVFGGEHWEEEQTPCLWAARQAGIPENAVATVHKLLLKGKPYGQVVKNHSIIHFHLDTNMIHDYIRYCIEFSATSLGRKPHWVLQYLQNEQHPQPRSSQSPRPLRQDSQESLVHRKALAHPSAAACEAPGNGPSTAPLPESSSRTFLDGYVGLQLCSDRHVIAVKDLMDRNNRLQGEPGYANPLVQTGDVLTHINGKPLADESLDEMHRLLGGPRGSLVELTLTNGSQEFLVSAVRHAPHVLEGSPTETLSIPAKAERTSEPAPAEEESLTSLAPACSLSLASPG